MVEVGRPVAGDPPHPVGGAPAEPAGEAEILRLGEDGEGPAQRLLVRVDHLEPVHDQPRDPLADLHRFDLLEREGGGHAAVDRVEPGVDHLGRSAGKGEPGARRRNPELRGRHGERPVAPAVEDRMARYQRSQRHAQLVEIHLVRGDVGHEERMILEEEGCKVGRRPSEGWGPRG
jgi:hypothetical protein